jgi:hypothetical protein
MYVREPYQGQEEDEEGDPKDRANGDAGRDEDGEKKKEVDWEKLKLDTEKSDFLPSNSEEDDHGE